MTPLARLNARIADLEAQRAKMEANVSTVETMPPPAVDWESRLSAAKAVDALTGSNTASAIEAQRQADTAAREKQARKAAQEALQATQRREALSTLTRDLEAAQSLLQRELSASANHRLADYESRYHRARAEWLETAERYAGCLELSGQTTAAHQLLRAVGVAGDTMTLMNRRANLLRRELLEETENV